MYQNPSRGAFGVSTFFKAPVARMDEPWDADIAFLGVPFDEATTYRPGTRFGPRAVREASLRYAFFAGDTPGYWDIASEIWRIQKRVVDLGDVDVGPLNHQQCYDNVTAAVKTVLQRGALPVTIGGDHSITLPILQAYEGREPFVLVHFDAHTDYREHVGGQRIGHAQVIRRSCELDWVERSVSIGIRAMRTDPADVRAMVERGNTVLTSRDVHSAGVEAIAARYLPKGQRIYVSFDIDSMDPAVAPGTGTTEAGGLGYEQARSLLQLLAEHNTVVGFDMVEVNPMLDVAQMTAQLAAQLTIDFLGYCYPGQPEAAGRLLAGAPRRP
jgi:agmatinase